MQCSGGAQLLADGRYAHSTVLKNDQVYLFGGSDGVRHDDVIKLDLQHHVWTQEQIHGLELQRSALDKRVAGKRHETDPVSIQSLDQLRNRKFGLVDPIGSDVLGNHRRR